ncbi:phage head-tail adapter protein [Moraxella bovoculi]|uniref:head-tail connector protein n=1 Tax=Moraxella bovoculi TaxID=386891 RepID=UPI000624BCD6|nr:head-tail connector protein [Moraxella bovoculi]AKG09373.1 phage head-tail adapter protein [Moraxella bovoculi]AKG13199.1 phage head-tail adapter protein [Moraxella bovoculi]
MSQFATLDEVKHHLRYDDDSSDVMLTAYLQSAEQSVENYITDEIKDEMLPVLKVATLLMVGYLDDNRNSENGAEFGNYLPAPVRQMLSPYRMPTF